MLIFKSFNFQETISFQPKSLQSCILVQIRNFVKALVVQVEFVVDCLSESQVTAMQTKCDAAYGSCVQFLLFAEISQCLFGHFHV